MGVPKTGLLEVALLVNHTHSNPSVGNGAVEVAASRIVFSIFSCDRVRVL